MKVPKEVVREAQMLALNLLKSGVISRDEQLWTHAMLTMKMRYHSAKIKAVNYGFINQPGETVSAVTGSNRVQSACGTGRAKDHVHSQSMARRAFAGRLLRSLRNPKGLGGAA